MTTDCDPDSTIERTRAHAGLGFRTLTALLFLAALAATTYFCSSMSEGMPMPGGWTMSMMWMRMPDQTWLESAGMFLLMWLAMMVAMMLPSSLPMILRYHHAHRSENERTSMGSTSLLMCGYFFVWSVIGAVIYIGGIPFALATTRWSELSLATPFLIGATVLIAGCMQFMPWTMLGLLRCREPLSCDMTQEHGNPRSAWRLGVRCGTSCVACCCGPTLILLALGMMNPIVIGAVAAVIAMEKLLPSPEIIVRISGVAALVAGMIILGRSVLQT
jgi:predicted metal-binding membrane protein